MVLGCVLFALFTVGVVVPCMIDVATSPPWAIRTLSRRTWLVILILFSVVGCAAWLIVGRPRRMPMLQRRTTAGLGISPAEAFRRHPAGRAMGMEVGEDSGDDYPGGRWTPRPMGPDDDPDFLLELERRIREARDDR
jgi:hypothetical protein